MSFWKKAISTAASAAMLASLLVAGTVSAAGPSASTGNGLSFLATCTPANCTQVADGITQMQLQAPAGTALTATEFMTITGASFVSAAGHYSYNSTTGALTVAAGTSVVGDTINIKSSTVGTAVITIWDQPIVTNPPVNQGSVSVTFVAASTLSISAANSHTKVVTYSGTPATDCAWNAAGFFSVGAVSGGSATAGTPRAELCVRPADGNGNAVSGATVSASISPVGLVGGAQAVTLTETAAGSGIYAAAVSGSGVAGNATITISAYNTTSGTVSLGTQAFNFTGDLASVTATSYVSALDKSSGASQRAVSFKAFDAAKNRVDGTSLTWTGTPSSGAPFSVDAASTVKPTTTTSGQIWVICNGLEGKGTVTVSAKNAAGTTISSNAVTVYCSGTASSFTVAFDKAAVAPGGSATLTATSLDSAGQPAAGVNWNAYASSGNLYTNPNTDGDQGDGTWTWSYLAPFQTGTISAAVVDLNPSVAGGYTNLGTKYASLTIGSAPAAAGNNASALGITHSGPFSTSTKVAALGKYETFKMTLGSSAAGKTVAILVAKKSSSGVWGSFTRLTSRVADASGNVYFYWRSSSAAWVSVRGSLDTTMTNAVQGRWR